MLGLSPKVVRRCVKTVPGCVWLVALPDGIELLVEGMRSDSSRADLSLRLSLHEEWSQCPV